MLKPVQIAHYFPVPAEQVFDAWLNPPMVKLWMFKSSSNIIKDVRIERWVGGGFSVLEMDGDEEIDHYGQFKEITGPRRLGFSLEVPKHFPGVTTVDIVVEPATGGCKLTLTQTGVPARITEGPWTEMLRNLEALLTQKNK